MTDKEELKACPFIHALDDMKERIYNGKDHEEYTKAYWLDDNWDVVVNALHLASEHRDVYLCHVLAEIRDITGVGHKPMLSELADEIKKVIADRQAPQDVAWMHETVTNHMDENADNAVANDWQWGDGLVQAIDIFAPHLNTPAQSVDVDALSALDRMYLGEHTVDDYNFLISKLKVK